MPGPRLREDYRPDVDGLRALAVFLVIAFHAGGNLTPGGFIGVDVFFVISGFLISTIIFKAMDAGNFSFPGFYARRIRRIFPALILVLLAVWVIGWYTLTIDEYARLGQHIVAGAGFISNIVLWRQSGYFAGPAEFTPLLHLWSLGIEEQYYLVWPLTIFAIRKAGANRRNVLLWILGISFALNIITTRLSPEAAFYLPHARFWELVMGGVLAEAQLRKNQSAVPQSLFDRVRFLVPSHEVKAFLGLLLVVGSALLLTRTSSFPGYWAVFPTAGASLLIWAGPDAWINRRMLSNRVMVQTGLISYPLYLWHWPLLSFARITRGDEPSWSIKSAIVLFSFVLAWGTYRLVEKPIRFGAGLPAKRRAVPVLVAAMVVIGSLGIFTIESNGLPARYPEGVRWLANYDAAKFAPKWRNNECFLEARGDRRQFAASCTDSEPHDGPLVFLWGDSHAAELYQGLKELQSSYRFRIAQYTASSCPPVLSFDNPYRADCRKNNDWIREKIGELHPDLAILSAQNWFVYLPGVQQKILSTLSSLRNAGVRTVVIVGPNPGQSDSSTKQALATLTVQFQSNPRFEVSTGLMVPLTPYHSFSAAAVATNGTVTGNVVQVTRTYTVVPMVSTNILVKDFIAMHQRAAWFGSVDVGYNPATSSVEFGVGPSFSWKSLVLSGLADIGRDTQLAGGFTVGQALPANNPPKPLTTTVWSVKPAIGLSIRIPLGGASASK
jgi:peptidoglycan/LPS O-acetylase OafA/YrhL